MCLYISRAEHVSACVCPFLEQDMSSACVCIHWGFWMYWKLRVCLHVPACDASLASFCIFLHLLRAVMLWAVSRAEHFCKYWELGMRLHLFVCIEHWGTLFLMAMHGGLRPAGGHCWVVMGHSLSILWSQKGCKYFCSHAQQGLLIFHILCLWVFAAVGMGGVPACWAGNDGLPLQHHVFAYWICKKQVFWTLLWVGHGNPGDSQLGAAQKLCSERVLGTREVGFLGLVYCRAAWALWKLHQFLNGLVEGHRCF